VTEAETQRVVSLIHTLDRPSLPRHTELYHSNCGDAVTLAMVPSDLQPRSQTKSLSPA